MERKSRLACLLLSACVCLTANEDFLTVSVLFTVQEATMHTHTVTNPRFFVLSCKQMLSNNLCRNQM